MRKNRLRSITVVLIPFLLIMTVLQSNSVVSVNIIGYNYVDRQKPVIYSSYFGGSLEEFSYSFTLDSKDNIYITGTSQSDDYPTTTGVYNRTKPGQTGVFVAKFSSDGSTLLFSTWLGPATLSWEVQRDFPNIKLDSHDNIIITGTTNSPAFPVTSDAYQSSFGGERDAFVSELSNDGSTLLYSSFFGGNASEICTGLTIDKYDNIYLSGETNSTDLPVSANSYSQTLHGKLDIFIAKFSSVSNLDYTTYLGGSDVDEIIPPELAFDQLNNLIIAGDTLSSDYPVSTDALDNHYDGVALHAPNFRGSNIECCGDVVLSKLSENGSNLMYSSYLGGSNGDKIHSLATDKEGNVYIAGSTKSSNFPVTFGSFNQTYGGDKNNKNNFTLDFFGDAFLTKLTPDLRNILYSTYLGGENLDVGESLVITNDNKAIVGGITTSLNFPIKSEIYTNAELQSEIITNCGEDCNNEMFVTTFSADGSSLLFSTYFGGSSHDNVDMIKLNSLGEIVIIGWTASDNYPITPSAFQYDLSKRVINGTEYAFPDLTITIFGSKDSKILGTIPINSLATQSYGISLGFFYPTTILAITVVMMIRKKFRKK